MKYYYIVSYDSDPRNCSCKRFIIDENHHYICGNNEESDNWTKLEENLGYDGACNALINQLEEVSILHGEDVGTILEGVMISGITEEELDELYNQFNI